MDKDKLRELMLKSLTNENLKDISLVTTSTGTNEGNIFGQIYFVEAIGTTKNHTKIDYNVVLKQSTYGKALKKTHPISEIYLNEVYMYNKVLPAFKTFELKKGLRDSFHCTPKCLGSYFDNLTDVIILDDLKTFGYENIPKHLPLPIQLIRTILTKLAEFHAVSVAFEDQEPDQFRPLCEGLIDVWRILFETERTIVVFEAIVDDIGNLLEEQNNSKFVGKWRSFKHRIAPILHNLGPVKGRNIILHGDGRNNNFMIQTQNENKLALIDWQMSRYSSLIYELSYFLLACLSPEDFKSLDSVLEYYYNVFAARVIELGSDPSKLYPLKKFLKEWSIYGQYGVLMSCLLIKLQCTTEDEVIDIVDITEDGKEWFEMFGYTLKNTDEYKRRIRTVVDYAVKHLF